MHKGPPGYLYQLTLRTWNYIVNVGVSPLMPFIESRRTKLLNLLAIPCIPFMLFFAVLNCSQGRYLLAVFNLLTSCINVFVLWLHWKQRYLSARLVAILCSVVIYTFTGLFFHNGAEYFLLNILLSCLLVYDNKWLNAGLGLLIISAFLVIVLMPQHWYLADPVPRSRVWANIATSLVFIIVALSFFKHIQSDYQLEIEKQREALATMNKDKEKLFSIVAHDIRSPLATLEILLDMFRKGEYPEDEMEEAAAILHKKISQLGGSLDNVLRWSSRSMKGIQAQPVNFYLGPLATEVLYFFEMTIQQKGITVETSIPDDLMLYADKDQVSVILRNFLSNALKFSYAGGVIELKAQAVGAQVGIGITDHGTGMPPTQVLNLFSYNQSPGYGTGGERGTGLGLILCKEFAQQNNGTITVESNVDKGTRFTVYLPVGITVLKEGE
ncbi:HAMP domain-containing histidine kinase [Chitinophaga sp. G-6-1-13]|uniref:histidine kinase n=1 Tax=Chitinophaga fulva TaxID=2728842 RepID=A0A848GX25_9BACT|nr:HAMP domain-containing sensor histidine kinase [Chitinophaga fulva]NML40208.1 HAMP domain-containing histidine kinase [Chitinophaga fulva]